MQIENSTATDIDEIFRLYKMAADHQRSKKTVIVWPEFDRTMVATEIAENRQWKYMIDGQLACIWGITYSDAQIWGAKNADAAIYIHRIATNPVFRGRNFVSVIVDWAKEYAKANNKDFVRLDTIGNNTKLIAHYTNAGFNFLGMFKLEDTEGLPAHYHNGAACLFEMKI